MSELNRYRYSRPSAICRDEDGNFPLNEKDPIVQTFKEAIFESKGKANNELCFNMLVAGFTKDEVVKAAKKMAEGKDKETFAKRYGSEVIRRNGRLSKKERGKHDKYATVPYEETYIWRFVKKTFNLGKEAIAWPDRADRDSILKLIMSFCTEFHLGMCFNFKNATTRYDVEYAPRSMKEGIGACCAFTKIDEVRRQSILADEKIAQQLVIRHGYIAGVPGALRESYSQEQWKKRQIEDYYNDLYMLAVREDGSLEPLTENDLKEGMFYRTLSDVGHYCGVIKDAKSLANFELAKMAMDTMGVGVVHGKSRYYYNTTKRGYGRMLIKIRNLLKDYQKLINQGSTPEVARATIMGIFKMWCAQNNNTDNEWIMFKRTDWTPDEPETKTASGDKSKSTKTSTPRTRGAKQKLATADDIAKLLGGKE